MTSHVRYAVNDHIAVITLDRPEKLNALTLAMYDALGAAFRRARQDDDVRVVVLTGSGDRAFCVGADLTESIPALAENRFDISEWDDAHLKHTGLYKPILCAINGYCFGGGFEIMLGTDLRIASDTAVFSLPEPAIGIVPAGGTLVRLTRQVAYAHAMELMLTAGRFPARRLAEMGVLNAVVPAQELMPHTMAMAAAIRDLSPQALQVIKESVLGLSGLPLDQAFAQEAVLGQRAFTSADARKGLAAFAQGRKAVF